MSDAVSDVAVATPCGLVRGSVSEGVRRFLGIPYADAPVGALRFRTARRRERAASIDAASTPASAERMPLRGPIERITTGDDILTVSVWTPDAATDATLPVLVWVHGGSYRVGSAVTPATDGAALARAGIVVVTVGYRLGFDGFGRVPGDDANRGLGDVLEALRWTRDTISAFGGDPRRVTLGGMSSGAGMVLALLGSPATEGLIARAWAASPTLFDTTPAVEQRVLERLAARLGVAPTLDGLLAAGDDAVLQRAVREEFAVIGERVDDAPDPLFEIIPFAQNTGDALLPEGTAAGLARSGLAVPLLVGATRDEVDGAGAFGPLAAEPGDGADDSTARAHAAVALRAELERWRVPAAAAAAYVDGLGGEAAAPTAVSDRALSDLLFRSAPDAVAACRADASAPTWRYAIGLPLHEGAAPHGADTPHWFGNAGVDRTLLDLLVAYVSGEDPGWHPDDVGLLGALAPDPFASARPLAATWDAARW